MLRKTTAKNIPVEARVNLSTTSNNSCFLAMKTFKILSSLKYMCATTYSPL